MLLALLLAIGSPYQPSIVANEGKGPDGGIFAVYCENCSGAGGAGGSSSLVWVDGGRLGADVLSIPAIYIADGGINVLSLPPVFIADGGVNIENWPVVQPVSIASMPSTPVTGTFFQGTQPVSLATAPTTPVTGTFFQSTQPVSIATAPALVASSAVIGHVIVDTAPTTAVTGTFFQAVQPGSQSTSRDGGVDWPVEAKVTSITGPDGGRTLDVSGSHVVVDSAPVTHVVVDSSAAIGVTGPATDAQMRATPIPVSGTVTASVTGATLAAGSAVIGHVIADASAAVIGHVINDASSAVIGHVIADTGSTTAVTQATGSNLHAVIDSGSTTACTQATGTNLHVVVDAAPTTAVTLASTTITGTPAVSLASTTITGNVAVTAAAGSITGSNPCSNPTATLLGLSGATSGTGAVQLIGLSGTTKIYVCSLTVTGVSGTTPTFSLKYGTGTACATGGVTIVGPWTTAANTVYPFSPNLAVTPAGQELCYLDSGTSPVQNYNLTYVQQ